MPTPRPGRPGRRWRRWRASARSPSAPSSARSASWRISASCGSRSATRRPVGSGRTCLSCTCRVCRGRRPTTRRLPTRTPDRAVGRVTHSHPYRHPILSPPRVSAQSPPRVTLQSPLEESPRRNPPEGNPPGERFGTRRYPPRPLTRPRPPRGLPLLRFPPLDVRSSGLPRPGPASVRRPSRRTNATTPPPKLPASTAASSGPRRIPCAAGPTPTRIARSPGRSTGRWPSTGSSKPRCARPPSGPPAKLAAPLPTPPKPAVRPTACSTSPPT